MASGNTAAAYRKLRSLKLTPAQAAGAVGALTGESGPHLDANARNPTSGAIGIGQWLGGRAHGVRPGDVEGQLNHLVGELKGSERGALRALRAAKTPEQAAEIFTRQFERPSAGEIASSLPARQAAARQLLARLGKGDSGSSAPAQGTPGKLAIKGKVTAAHEAPDFGTAAEMVLRSGAKSGLPKLGTSRLAQANTLFKQGLATKTVPTSATQDIKATPGKAGTPTADSHDGQPHAKGIVDFEGKQVAAWIAHELKLARANGWTGKVESGYRSFAEQTRIYNSGVRPAAKPGESNHEGDQFPRGAVDVSNAAQLAKILHSLGRTNLSWAGAKDPVHFSHPHGGSY